MSVALIAAQSENRVIGRGLDIPWKVKGEQALFKEITLGGSLIMGRRTWESIGRPLPGREIIVVTRNSELHFDGCHTVDSLDRAFAKARCLNRPVFIAGGGEIYRETIATADAIHLTTIHTRVDGDVYFPELPDTYRLVREQRYESNLDYTYQYFVKNVKNQ